jgi:hypothetical protein
MKKITLATLTCSHILILAIGFIAGIYLLPILSAPLAPSALQINTLAINAQFNAEIPKSLEGSDFLHWGEGKFSLNSQTISFLGELSPGPDFKLYLSPRFVESEAEFLSLKSTMLMVGEVKTFDNFITTTTVPIALEEYNTIVVWCESFGEFITAAKYR